MQQTEHFSLNKPEGADPVRIEVLNANMDTLDSLLYDRFRALEVSLQTLRERIERLEG